MLDAYTKWVTTRRAWVVLITLLLIAYPLSGLRLLEFSTDYRIFFGGGDVRVAAFDSLQQTYATSDNILLAIEPAAGTVFNEEFLLALKKFTDKGWKIPHVTRADSIANFQHSYANGDELVVEHLVRNETHLTPSGIERIRNIALSEHILRNRLVSANEKVAGINLTIRMPAGKLHAELPVIVAAVRQMAGQLEADPAVKNVYLSGTVMINNAFMEVTMQDMMTLIPIMFLLIIAGMSGLLRSFGGTMATFLVVGFANAVALGMGSMLGIKLTPPSASAAPIIMTLTIATCVHVLVAFFKEWRREGVTKEVAMMRSLRGNFTPVSITSLTTLIGFLTMNFSESPPFNHLGNLAAIGVVAAWILSLAFLPALLMMLPIRQPKVSLINEGTMAKLAEFVIARRTPVCWTMVALSVGLLFFVPKNELNDEFLKYFDHSIEFRRHNDFITENLTGVYQLEYSLPAGESDGINDPEYLHTLKKFAEWYERQPYVIHVQSIVDVYEKANMNIHRGKQEYNRIPDDRQMAAQALLISELSLPFGLDLNDQIAVDKSASRFVVTVETISANDLIALENRAGHWLKKNGLPAMMNTVPTGPSVLFAHIGKRSINAGMVGGLAALLLISVVLIVIFRSFGVGLLSMVPNLLPAAMGFGLWGLLYGQVNMALATVISMTIGIVVDDTIHFINRYLRARREHALNPEDAIRHAFAHVGPAIIITSIVLVAGFLVLTVSPFVMNWGMGLLMSIIITFALLVDLLLLPPLLLKFEEKKNEAAVPVAVSP